MFIISFLNFNNNGKKSNKEKREEKLYLADDVKILTVPD